MLNAVENGKEIPVEKKHYCEEAVIEYCAKHNLQYIPKLFEIERACDLACMTANELADNEIEKLRKNVDDLMTYVKYTTDSLCNYLNSINNIFADVLHKTYETK